MTDQQILDMKQQGRLKINRDTGQVWVWHRKKRVWIEKKEDYNNNRARFRFDIPGCRRSTVYKNRLLFVYFNGVTNGNRVDHKDVDRTNDSVDNLQLHTPNESAKQGRSLLHEISLKYFNEWWDYVRFYGESPPDDAKDLGSVYA